MVSSATQGLLNSTAQSSVGITGSTFPSTPSVECNTQFVNLLNNALPYGGYSTLPSISNVPRYLSAPAPHFNPNVHNVPQFPYPVNVPSAQNMVGGVFNPRMYGMGNYYLPNAQADNNLKRSPYSFANSDFPASKVSRVSPQNLPSNSISQLRPIPAASQGETSSPTIIKREQSLPSMISGSYHSCSGECPNPTMSIGLLYNKAVLKTFQYVFFEVSRLVIYLNIM